MGDAEVAQWLKLFQLGGNAGIIVLAIIAVRVAKLFLDALRAIVTTAEENHKETIAGQEEIKRGIVALKPETAELFRSRASGG